MKLALIAVGGQREDWLAALSADYEKKISHFCDFDIIRLKTSKYDREAKDKRQALETADILKLIKKDDIVIVCDERGDSPTSRKWSEKLVKLFERGRPRVVIVIGGAFGFGPEIRARADWVWSLSSLTLNHHIAQAVALEQIYRAFAIWKNLPYHND
jgi:23S rRNA (pseudouridine1915-N3)-methyltransferase